MKTSIFISVIFCLTGSFLRAQPYVYLADKTPLFLLKNEAIYSPDGRELLYFKKGNIFFTGQSDVRQNIFLLTTSTDINSDQKERIYEKDNREASYSFSEGKVYKGVSDEADINAQNELLHIEKSGKWLAFYSSVSDSLLAYYLADSAAPSTAIITAYTLINQYDIPGRLEVKKAAGPFTANTYATLKPVWGNVTANEWLWDGQTLRPRWNVDPRLVWTFDGQTVKQMYESNIYEQYEWDGETFKPLWRSSRAQEWSWDGRIMKPSWDTDWANQYTIEDGVVKPWSNVHPEKEWHLDGDIPVPVIILVISGIAKTY